MCYPDGPNPTLLFPTSFVFCFLWRDLILPGVNPHWHWHGILLQINDTSGCADWMDSTAGPRPTDFSYFGHVVSVASNGLVVVGTNIGDAAFVYAIKETWPGNASLVLLADLIPAPGGLGIAASRFGPILVVFPIFFLGFVLGVIKPRTGYFSNSFVHLFQQAIRWLSLQPALS